MEKYILLFAIGLLAGFMNVMAGGGSSLSLPMLIFLGLDGATANGTNRVAIALQNVFAVSSFRRRKFHDFKKSFRYSLWTLPGALLGALVAVRIQDEWFQRILAIIILGVVLTMFLPVPGSKRDDAPNASNNNWIGALALVAIGFYGGFVQIGVGFLLMATLYHIFCFNLVKVNMHKVFIVFVYTIPALAVFIYTGKINWGLGLTLAVGNSIGGWWAAKVAVQKGEKAVRVVMAIALMVMAVKLLKS